MRQQEEPAHVLGIFTPKTSKELGDPKISAEESISWFSADRQA